ncbi:hypothetical protein [Streptomyces sp. NBC_01198]|uniref:hypothetical protein n=1 Tax=Streptomyces sp. NBC_01198 TaxID=2903769 RepID=UPI002E151DA5|nr:hypothetical protein OG702_03975 [Streptomyces sp. NBC_01198]
MGLIVLVAAAAGVAAWCSRSARRPAGRGPARSPCAFWLLWGLAAIAVLGIVWAIAASRNSSFFPAGF